MRLLSLAPDAIRTAAYGLTIPEGDEANTTLQRLIDKAIERVYNNVPSLDARIESGEITEELAQGVVEDMVIRVLRNPGGYRQVSIDDYTRMIDQAVSSGALYLSDEERRELTRRRKRKAIRSIRVALSVHRTPYA